MSDETKTPNQEEEDRQPAWTPASFEKRTAAWMGIGYMLLIMLVITFSIFTGKSMPGTFPLFLIPVAVAAIVVSVHKQRQGTAPGGLPLTILVVVICLAALVLGLLMGVPALVHAFQTAYV